MKLGSHEIGLKQVAVGAFALVVGASVLNTLNDAKDHLGCPGDQSTTYGQVSAAIDQLAAGKGDEVFASKACFSTLTNGEKRFAQIAGGASDAIAAAKETSKKSLQFTINDYASRGRTYADNNLKSFLEKKGGLDSDTLPNGVQSDCGLAKDGKEIALVCNLRDKASALSASEFSDAAEGKFPAIAIVHDLREAPKTEAAPTVNPAPAVPADAPTM